MWTWTREEILWRAGHEPEPLADDVLAMRTRLEELETRQAQNSTNSSKPPSSDGLGKPAPKSQRVRGTRATGGQPGHRGRTLEPVAEPDEVILHALERCPCGCERSLSGAPVLRHDRRQVFELPPQQLVVTEHRVEVKRCPVAGREVSAPFPPGVDATAQYGQRFHGWLVYLRVAQLLPLRRIRQMVGDLFGQPVSEATVEGAVQSVHDALPPFERALVAALQHCPVLHADESGLRVDRKLHWLHVLCSERFTWYGVHPRRGRAALDDFGILKDFSGRLVHDCLRSYFLLSCAHALCNSHLVRELTFLHEQIAQPWAGHMKALLLEMYVQRHLWNDTGIVPTAEEITALHARYQALLTQGYLEQPAPVRTGTRGRLKRTKAHNLLDRLRKHQACVLAFLRDPSIPFTNNQAEQDLRMLKVQQKISGCFRTLDGAKTFARIRSYASTVRKHGLDILDALQNALAGSPFCPSYPAYSGP
jgi:transposase